MGKKELTNAGGVRDGREPLVQAIEVEFLQSPM